MGAALFILFPQHTPSQVWICHFIYLMYLFMEWLASSWDVLSQDTELGQLRCSVPPRVPIGFDTRRVGSGHSLLCSLDPTKFAI